MVIVIHSDSLEQELGRLGNNLEGFNTIMCEVRRIYRLAWAQIFGGILILLLQTLTIGANYEFSTRSLTGIWTSWFFFMAGGISIFWSTRCTFHGLLAVLVLQTISATMTIPLITACGIVLNIYPFVFDSIKFGLPRVISSYLILTSNLVMILAGLLELVSNLTSAYKCYILAYGGGGGSRNEECKCDKELENDHTNSLNVNELRYKPEELDLPVTPPPDTNFDERDIRIIKRVGFGSIVIALLIFIDQTIMYAQSFKNEYINKGVGFWGALYFFLTGIATIYNVMRKIPGQFNAILTFFAHTIQLVLSIPIIALGYYVIAGFGSCLQQANTVVQYKAQIPDCGGIFTNFLMISLGGVLSLAGMVLSLLSVFVLLVFSQSVCGIRCMSSGATVYPTL